MARCTYTTDLAPTWSCGKPAGHTDDHLLMPPPHEASLFCPRCGSGPLLNSSDGIECPDCGRALTPDEIARLG